MSLTEWNPPPSDMGAGDYVARCIAGVFDEKMARVILDFEIVNDPFTEGVNLHGWNTVKPTSNLGGKYGRECRIAADKPACEMTDEDVQPGVFVDKTFMVRVGFSKKDPATGRPVTGQRGVELSRERKDDRDQLKVHEILGLWEDPAKSS